jgi:hypothetical protein
MVLDRSPAALRDKARPRQVVECATDGGTRIADGLGGFVCRRRPVAGAEEEGQNVCLCVYPKPGSEPQKERGGSAKLGVLGALPVPLTGTRGLFAGVLLPALVSGPDGPVAIRTEPPLYG